VSVVVMVVVVPGVTRLGGEPTGQPAPNAHALGPHHDQQ
jgi:hypothetical protein